MEFDTFFQNYGGSLRAKNVWKLPQGAGGMASWLWRLLRGKTEAALGNKRFFGAPSKSRLPQDLIRLEPWEGEYLYLLASRAHKTIVEVGRFYGGSTFLLACANDRVPIYSVDIEPQDDERLKGFFDQENVGRNVSLIVGDSQHTQYDQIDEIDLLFIDGDHSYQGCTNDLNNWYSKVAPGGHVVLHDCYFGNDVQQSVIDFISANPVNVIRSPYIIRSHWQTPYGSLAHFVKPARSHVPAERKTNSERDASRVS